MTQELGKIEKMPVDSYKKGRKIFFVPVIYLSESLPEDFIEKCNRYCEQVEKQIAELSVKLGDVKIIYHELIAASDEDGIAPMSTL